MALSLRTCSLAAALVVVGAACSHEPAQPPPSSPMPPSPSAMPATPPPPSGTAAPSLAVDAINEGLPGTAPVQLSQRVACAKGTCTLAHLVPDELKAAAESSPAMIWEEALGEHAELDIPVDAGVEIVGVLLDGAIEMHPKEKGGEKLVIDSRWHGFRAPGGGISIVTTGKPARVALVLSVAAPDATIAANVARLDKKDPKLAWKQRPKRLDSIDFTKTDEQIWGGGAFHARIGWAASKYSFTAPGTKKAVDVDDHPTAVVDLVMFSKNAAVPTHAHDRETECLAIFEGEGQLEETAPRQAIAPIKPGSVICIPAGTHHAWKPAGTTKTFALQVFTPPGPEQRYRNSAERVEGSKPAPEELKASPGPVHDTKPAADTDAPKKP